MIVLRIGSGGREHALAWALSASPVLSKLYAAPGNGGICEDAECVSINVGDHEAVVAFCRDKSVDLVVVGPEAPLVAGLADALAEAGITVFGPSAAAAQLEGSKGFTKALCREAGIPTAAFEHFTDRASALDYLEGRSLPIVIKADGLAAGKGVIIAQTMDEASQAIKDILGGKFGDAGASLVIEDFLVGEEASFFALADGKTVLPLTTAQDHKQVFDGDEGPNTGGMGAYSPAPVMDETMIARTMAEIIEPTVAALADRGTPFRGVLYAGLMITEKGPELIEYNVRFGDPESQVLVMRLKDDILLLLKAAADGILDQMSVRWVDDVAITVVMAARGYPSSYDKGTEIRGIEAAERLEGVTVFHAGTTREGERLLATGGRVLSVTATGPTIEDAQALAYKAVDLIDWPEGFCRRDIGWRAIGRGHA